MNYDKIMQIIQEEFDAENIRVRHEKESSKLGLFVFFFRVKNN